MKYLYSLLMLVVLTAPACKKDNNGTDDPANTQPAVTFMLNHYGCSELRDVYFRNYTMVQVYPAPTLTEYTYEMTGSNGLKSAEDTLVKGSGKTNGIGRLELYLPGMRAYKDGTITIKFTFAGMSGTFEASTEKAEYIIRDYKDLLSMSDMHAINQQDSTDSYVQTADIAFPDTVFRQSPVRVGLHGAYDGQGHKITNLSIAAPVIENDFHFLGLFSSVAHMGIIKNVRLELSAAGISSLGPSLSGGIVGLVENGSVLNCSVKGNIKSPVGNSEIGGIVGQLQNGRVTGCAFKGYLESTLGGGIAGFSDHGYINMCYADFSMKSTQGGGLVGIIPVRSGGVPADTVLNSYAHITNPQVTYLWSVVYRAEGQPFAMVAGNCFSNAGTAQDNVVMYSAIDELNTQLAGLQVSNLPAGIAAPPGNKPFKITLDTTDPASLWWE